MVCCLFVFADRDACYACWDGLARADGAVTEAVDVIRFPVPGAPGEGAGDARFVREGHPCLWLTVTHPSQRLHAVLREALDGAPYRLLDEGDPARPLTLEAALAAAASGREAPMRAADGCPLCGRPLEPWIDGSTQGAYCPPCGRWHVVTTYWPPILADRRVYRVALDPVARPNAVQVRAVARLMGVSFPEARRAAEGAPAIVFAGRAEAVLPVLAALAEAEAPVTVDPSFPWTAADAWETVSAMGLRPAPQRPALPGHPGGEAGDG